MDRIDWTNSITSIPDSTQILQEKKTQKHQASNREAEPIQSIHSKQNPFNLSTQIDKLSIKQRSRTQSITHQTDKLSTSLSGVRSGSGSEGLRHAIWIWRVSEACDRRPEELELDRPTDEPEELPLPTDRRTQKTDGREAGWSTNEPRRPTKDRREKRERTEREERERFRRRERVRKEKEEDEDEDEEERRERETTGKRRERWENLKFY